MDGTFDDFLATISITKIAACAELVGLMERLFEATLEHVKMRNQFGRPLSKFQVIQHRLADAYANLELSRSHLLRLAALKDTDENYEQMISGAKAFISKSARALAEDAVQLHGGMGMTDEYDVGLYLKRARVLEASFGNTAYCRNRFASLGGY